MEVTQPQHGDRHLSHSGSSRTGTNTLPFTMQIHITTHEGYLLVYMEDIDSYR